MYNYEQDNDLDNDAEFALLHSTYNLTSQQVQSSDQDYAKKIISLMHLIDRIQKSKGDLFKIGDLNDKHIGGEWVGRIVFRYPYDHKNARIASWLIEHLQFWKCSAIGGFPLHVANPYFQYFFSEAERCGLNLSSPHYQEIFYGCGPQSSLMCGYLNSFIQTIRHIDTNVAVIEAMRKFRRSAADNYRSVTEYVTAMFNVHSRLLIVRVDLGYKKSPYDFHGNNEIPIEEFLDHRKHLLNDLQRHWVFEDLHGYVIKAEHGRDKGFHLHCLLMFNSSEVRQGISHGTRIGKFWIDQITQGKGLYYNCNQKGTYFYSGVGMVNHNDAEKRLGIDFAVKYMTKSDAIMRLSLGNARIISRGIMPKIRDVKLGRPRYSESCDIDFPEEEIT